MPGPPPPAAYRGRVLGPPQRHRSSAGGLARVLPRGLDRAGPVMAGTGLRVAGGRAPTIPAAPAPYGPPSRPGDHLNQPGPPPPLHHTHGPTHGRRHHG